MVFLFPLWTLDFDNIEKKPDFHSFEKDRKERVVYLRKNNVYTNIQLVNNV